MSPNKNPSGWSQLTYFRVFVIGDNDSTYTAEKRRIMRRNEASEWQDSSISSLIASMRARCGCWNIPRKTPSRARIANGIYICTIHMCAHMGATRSGIWISDVFLLATTARPISVSNYTKALRIDRGAIEERFCATWSRCCNGRHRRTRSEVT